MVASPGLFGEIGMKLDACLAAELADLHQVPIGLIELCHRDISEALRRGWGDKDRTVASTLQEERAGVELRVERQPTL